MERKASTLAAQSSRPSQPGRLSSVHIVVSSFAALAGVALAAYQAFGPSPAPQTPPVTVTLAIDPQQASPGPVTLEQPAVKSNAEVAAALDQGATYSAALKDGSGTRYNFGDLFDGKPDTYLTLMEPDSEINVMVTFNSASAQPVSEIDYTPPAGVDPTRAAAVADVMVLPEGQMEASGRPVASFSLPSSGGRQSFALPNPEPGKGVWLRIAGAPGAKGAVVGDFAIRRAN